MKFRDRIKKSWDYRFGLLKYDVLRYYMRKPQIMSVKETVDYILQTGCSLARFGDGEVELMHGASLGFQQSDERLARHLEEVFKSKSPNLLIGLPSTLATYKFVNPHDADFWRKHLARTYKKWYGLLNKDMVYGEAFISRFYTILLRKNAEKNLRQVQRLWENRDIVMVEGEFSRLGVGNDCFKGARTVSRILCPAENAFEKYDMIISAVKKHAQKDQLLILALGPTATVLAYDLSKLGFQALDLGHVDLEYEWWRMKADGNGRGYVRGKYNNEEHLMGLQQSAVVGNLTAAEWKQYKNEILTIIQ